MILFNNTTVIPFKSGSQYGCFYCGEKYRDYKEFIKHTKSHGPCNVKHKSLVTQKYGTTVEVKLDISNVTCELCDEPFNSLDEIISHLIAKHGLRYDQDVPMCLSCYRLVDLKCTECGKSFEYFRNLVMHARKNHMEKLLPCEHCDKSFNKKSDLAAHCRIYHRRAGFQCIKCELYFRTTSLLRLHLMNTHGASESKCARILSRLKSRSSYLRLGAEDLAALEDIDDCEIESQRKRLRERNAIAKRNRENIACILNMTTAIPFKYYQNRFTCFHCSKDFNEHEDVRTHTLLEHPFYDLERKCPKSLKGVNVCIKLDITSLSCRICFEPFNDFDMLVDHLISNHKANYDKSVRGIMQPFKLEKYKMACPLCPQAFSYFNILLKHMNLEHSPKTRLCSNCGAVFASEALLTMHIARIHGPKVFKCIDCNAELNSALKLKSHRAKAHGMREVPCQKCPEKFPSEYERQKHLIQAHDIGHKCSYCGKMFVKNSFMRNHIRRTHMEEKNVQCAVCNHKFFDNHLLKIHMVKHVGERDFHCDVCGKSFFWKKNLRVHMASHNKQSKTTGSL